MKQRGAIAFLVLLALISPLHANSFTTGEPDDVVAQIETLVKKKNANAESIDNLIAALNNPDTNIRVRERAAWALGQLNAKKAVPALLKAAEHKGLLIRSAALDSLVRIKPPTALPVFISIAESDPILSLRQRGTLALGLLHSDKAIKPLVKLSEDKSPEVRGASALSMAALHSKKNDFSEVLKEMEGDADPYVKERAQRGMEVAKQKNVAVRSQLKSQDNDIRLFAALYFHQHGKHSDLNLLKDAWNVEADDQVRYELEQAIKAVKKRKTASSKKQTKINSSPQTPSSK